MNRMAPLLLLVLVTCIASASRPNFVIFIADDMAWEDCGAYGHPSVRTPNIDALAKAGLRCDRAYLTCSSCSPSRCSILTGRYPHNTGAGELHLPLPGEQTMLTRPLKESGYWTAAVGKWHLGDAVTGQFNYRKPARPEAMGEAWTTALRERPMDKPFFLWAAHSDPHRPYAPGAVDPPHLPADVLVPPFLPDTPKVRKDMALYYDEVSRFDQHIGMVLRELDAEGIADNTFVLVISDNGRPFPHCKTGVHGPGIRTPLVVRWPAKVSPGTLSHSVVSSIDIAPTVLELAGLEAPGSFQGKSFVPLLSDPSAEIRRYAFAEHNWHDYRAFERAALDDRYCYVRNWLSSVPGTPPADAVTSATYAEMKRLLASGKLSEAQQLCFVTPRDAEFLFDLEADPDCIRNLATDAGQVEKLHELRAALEVWQKTTGDRFPGALKLTPDGFDRTTGKRLINAAHPSLQRK